MADLTITRGEKKSTRLEEVQSLPNHIFCKHAIVFATKFQGECGATAHVHIVLYGFMIDLLEAFVEKCPFHV